LLFPDQADGNSVRRACSLTRSAVGSNEMTDPIPAVDLDQGTMPCRLDVGFGVDATGL